MTGPAKLEARVQELEDHAEIRGLLDSYAATIDDKDWANFSPCFTDDAVSKYTWGTFTNPTDLQAALIDIVAPFTVTEHLIGNVQITVEGDQARSHSKLWVICVAPDDDGDHLVEGGYYEHEYKRGSDRWKISLLDCKLTWAINGEPL